MRLQLGSKMRIAFLAMAVLLVTGGLVTILYTYRMQRVATRLLADNVSSLKAAQELEVALFGMRGLTSNYILDGDPQWLTTLEAAKTEFRKSLFRATQTVRVPDESVVMKQISTLFAEYEHDLQGVVALNSKGEAPEAKHLLAHATREVFAAICERCETWVTMNEGYMFDAVAQIGRTNRNVRIAMYGLGLGGVAMGYILGVVISRSIAKPIYELVLKVRGAAGGEFVERLDVARGSELEALDRHVDGLIHRINTTRSDLEKNRRLLARADKLAALGKVSAGIAHEIRNPLSAIKMLSYSLHERLPEGDDMRRDLAVIVKEIDRTDRFVHNFLRFARPPDPSVSPVRLDAVVRETLELLRPRLRQAGVETVEDYGEAAALLADPDQLRQLVMNLTLNAIEAMEGGGRLTVEIQRVPAGGSSNGAAWVQLRMTDTGPGIPDEILDNVFDPFVSGRPEGTGLGLAMSHQIVLSHRGWIDAANIPGGGAVFTVRIPEANS